MNQNSIYSLISFIPFVLFISLLFFRKLSILKIAFITFLVTLIVAGYVWQMYPLSILVATGKGTLVALDILFIILGAVFFLEVVRSKGVIEGISHYLASVSSNRLVQVIILAWFFEGFIEATAGFGTPVAVVAPILMTLGFSPLMALTISLFGNSTSVAFGALGTPSRVGFSGLDTPQVWIHSSLYNMVGILIPMAMIWVALHGNPNRKAIFIKALPGTIVAGLLYTLLALGGSFFGEEFPAVIGSLGGLAIFIFLVKTNVLKFPSTGESEKPQELKESVKPLKFVAMPYFILLVVLIIGKIIFSSLSIDVSIFSHSISIYNPGFAFLTAGIIFAAIVKMPFKTIYDFGLTALRKSINPFVVTVLMSAIVQIMDRSSQNTLGLISMTGMIAASFASVMLPIWTPAIGAFGAFMTGSATVSNLLFTKSIVVSATKLGLNTENILGVQLSGAAAGNVIAISDIVAGVTVVNMKDGVRRVLQRTLPVCIVYILILGIIAFLANIKI